MSSVVVLHRLLFQSTVLFLITGHLDRLLAEPRRHPAKANFVEALLAFVRQLRLFATQLERMLAALLHHPATEWLVGWIRLGYVAVTVLVPVLDQLLVARFPSNGRFGHAPEKANTLQLCNALFRKARLGLFARGSITSFLEIRLVLVFALHLDPLAQIRRLRDVAMTIDRLVFLQLFKALLPTRIIIGSHNVPNKANRGEDLHPLFGETLRVTRRKLFHLVTPDQHLLECQILSALGGNPSVR